MTAQSIYERNYQFAKPPAKPHVTVAPGDEKVTLYWDDIAESSVDPISEKEDFEGYAIYRSTDPQFLDQQTITDAYGSHFLFTPLEMAGGAPAKFDLVNDYSGLAPRDRNRYELAMDGGFNFFNPFTKMEGDVVGAGIVFAKVSDSIVQLEEQAGIHPISDYEFVFEITGQFPATPWVTLQPNLQWIYHPGSSSALSNSLVISIRLNFTF